MDDAFLLVSLSSGSLFFLAKLHLLHNPHGFVTYHFHRTIFATNIGHGCNESQTYYFPQKYCNDTSQSETRRIWREEMNIKTNWSKTEHEQGNRVVNRRVRERDVECNNKISRVVDITSEGEKRWASWHSFSVEYMPWIHISIGSCQCANDPSKKWFPLNGNEREKEKSQICSQKNMLCVCVCCREICFILIVEVR